MANENKRDYYEVLGLTKDATEADIKKAYRKMAAKYHPDINHEPDAEERFKEINEANEVLSDPDKRARYDQYGFAGVDPNFNPNMGGGFGGFGGGFGGFGGFGDLGDIFGNIFGGGTGRSQRSANAPTRGEDITARIEVTFEEAAFGTEKNVSAHRIETCDKCSGSCAEPGTKVETCNRCRGRGTVNTQQNFMGMVVQSETACPDCRGTGKKIPNPCQRCKGKGRIRRPFTYKIKVPKGIDNDQTLRIPGEGCSGTNGGPAGNLLVSVRVKPHDVFKREGTAVYCDLPISFTQAALGAEIEVPTIDGKVPFTVSEGTQTGTTVRLRGKGIPFLNSESRGDQFVTVIVETPTHLTKEQKELLRQFEQGASDKTHPKRKKFWDRFR